MRLQSSISVTHEIPGVGPCTFSMRARTQGEVIRWAIKVSEQTDSTEDLEVVSRGARLMQTPAGEVTEEILAEMREAAKAMRGVQTRAAATAEEIASVLGPLIESAWIPGGERLELEDGVTWERAMLCPPLGIQWTGEFFRAYLEAVGVRRGKSEAP